MQWFKDVIDFLLYTSDKDRTLGYGPKDASSSLAISANTSKLN
ncbi:hypothetical protein [Aquimarina pacifica]|nr:hypothetical protein [Aquimarina pacifica]